jgi:hypothetical protein
MLLEVPIVVAMPPMRIAQLTGIRVFESGIFARATCGPQFFDQARSGVVNWVKQARANTRGAIHRVWAWNGPRRSHRSDAGTSGMTAR